MDTHELGIRRHITLQRCLMLGETKGETVSLTRILFVTCNRVSMLATGQRLRW
jgi:hypothetical protein